MTIRLNKLLARRGLGARRKCDALIQSGAVRVNGTVVTEPGTQVEPERDRIVVNGRPLPGASEHRYYMLHKPVGVITTLDDPEGRRTIREFLPAGGRVYPIGRLDADTSGLLLLTNDGELAHRLMHPRYGVEKHYRVRVDREPDSRQLDRLRGGVEFEDGIRSQPAEVRILRRDRETCLIAITIHEGRYRQVRRMCEAVGLEVRGLHRSGYGPLFLGLLERGLWRELSEAEVAKLRAVSARPMPRRNTYDGGVPRGPRAGGAPRPFRADAEGEPREAPRRGSAPPRGREGARPTRPPGAPVRPRFPREGTERRAPRPLPGEPRSLPGERRPFDRERSGARRPFDRPRTGARRPDDRPRPGARRPDDRPRTGARRPDDRPRTGERRPFERPRSSERRSGPFERERGGSPERRPFDRAARTPKRPEGSSRTPRSSERERSGGPPSTFERPRGPQRPSDRTRGPGRPFERTRGPGRPSNRRPDLGSPYDRERASSGQRRGSSGRPFEPRRAGGGEGRPFRGQRAPARPGERPRRSGPFGRSTGTERGERPGSGPGFRRQGPPRPAGRFDRSGSRPGNAPPRPGRGRSGPPRGKGGGPRPRGTGR